MSWSTHFSIMFFLTLRINQKERFNHLLDRRRMSRCGDDLWLNLEFCSRSPLIHEHANYFEYSTETLEWPGRTASYFRLKSSFKTIIPATSSICSQIILHIIRIWVFGPNCANCSSLRIAFFSLVLRAHSSIKPLFDQSTAHYIRHRKSFSIISIHNDHIERHHTLSPLEWSFDCPRSTN